MTAVRGRMSLASRLLLAQVAVILAMAVTVVAVAAGVGPPAFDRHMLLAGHAGPEVLAHGEAAFVSAGLTAVAAGFGIAAVGAIAASAVVTRRIGAALRALAAGAERVAAGDYTTPVALAVPDRELRTVADTFNGMAARIADSEATRRRMLTDLSHELRTPLASIELLLEGLEDGLVPFDAATTATLRAQTARLTRLATDIRDVSAAEEGRLVLSRELVGVGPLVDAAVTSASAAAEAAHVRLLSADEEPHAVVEADRGRIGQVLDNLLRNAIQHTPPGRTVRVSTGSGPGVVRIEVRDEGAGIAAEDLPHIFERFYRGGTRRHDQGAGTGVGLAISRAIAVAHGGSLTASSDGPGRGAQFVLTLPARG